MLSRPRLQLVFPTAAQHVLAQRTQPKPSQSDEESNRLVSTCAPRYFNELTRLNLEDAPQRRGPKGYFTGSRKEFLESQLPAYMVIKKGIRRGFWHKFWSTWWQRYPWGLEDDEEPPADDPDKMARLVSVGPGQQALKVEVENNFTVVR